MLKAISRLAVVAAVLVGSVTTSASPAAALTNTGTIPADGASVQPPVDARAIHDAPLDTLASTISMENKNGNLVDGAVSFDIWNVPNDTIVFTPTSTLTEAGSPYEVTVHAEELVGAGTTDTVFTFFVDTTAPAAPTITSVTNPVNATSQTALSVAGGAEAGSTVTVTIDDRGNPGTSPIVEQVTAGSDYLASLDVSTLVDGILDVTASATDEAGNTSTAASTETTKDSAVPASPGVTITEDPIDATNQGSITISGTSSEPALDIDISVDDEGNGATPAVTTSTSTALDGTWSVQMDLSSLAQGTITASAVATDAAGNSSPAGTDTSLKDLGPPDLVSTSPAGGSSVQAAPEITVTYNEVLDTADSTLSVADNTDVALSGAVSFRDGDRTIVFTPTGALPEGGSPYTVTLAVEDLANRPEATPTAFTFTIDATAPEAPTITDADDPVIPSNQATVSISGSAEAGSTVEVTVEDEAAAQVTDTVETSGSWTMSVDVTALEDGTLSVTATATDAAGNTSASTPPVEIAKDTTAPTAPTITSADDPVTPNNEASFALAGDAEAGSTVDVTVSDGAGGSVDGSTTANSPWSMSLDLSALDAGVLTITATATDAVGNVSAATESDVYKMATTVLFVPYEQDVDGSFTPLAGDFDGDGVEDVFWYQAGTGTDPLWLSNADGTFTVITKTVSGTYQPLVGDYDGDLVDDIFWYRPGSGADHLWLSNADGTFTAISATVNGTYQPLVGDFDGDFVDDIFWYRPGTDPDYLWLSNADGSFTQIARPVNGTYQPLVGDYDGDLVDDIFWYRAGSGADYLWLSNADGTFTQIARPVNGTYQPLVGDYDGDLVDDIFWYQPGSGADYLWLSNADGSFTQIARPVNGTYQPLVGDFNGDLVGDIFWYRPGSGADYLWLSNSDGSFTQSSHAVNGTYQPIAGDFDGDWVTDVFWYGAGTAPDELDLVTPYSGGSPPASLPRVG